MSSINVCISIFCEIMKSMLNCAFIVDIFHRKKQFSDSVWIRNADKPGSECRPYCLPLWFSNNDKVTQLTLTCQDSRSKRVCVVISVPCASHMHGR